MQSGGTRIRERPRKHRARRRTALVPVREAERDLRVDPRLREPGARRQLERPRRGGDRGGRLERHRLDPQPGTWRAPTRRPRRCARAARSPPAPPPEPRPSGPATTARRRARSARGRGRGRSRRSASATASFAARSACCIRPSKLSARDSRTSSAKRSPASSSPPNRSARSSCRPASRRRADVLGLGCRQCAEPTRVRRQPCTLSVVRQACVVALLRGVGESRKHPRGSAALRGAVIDASTACRVSSRRNTSASPSSISTPQASASSTAWALLGATVASSAGATRWPTTAAASTTPRASA